MAEDGDVVEEDGDGAWDGDIQACGGTALHGTQALGGNTSCDGQDNEA